MSPVLLHIDSSARQTQSTTRDLSERIVAKFDGAQIIRRDLSQTLPLIDETWIAANFTPDADRTVEQRETLALSDTLVAELEASDVIVIGLPIYNFTVPATFKAWIDQVARAGKTFRYTEAGPEGLLKGKRAILAVASGGTRTGSEIDFATGYARFMLGFIGITDVEIIAADQLAIDPEASLKAANDAIGRIAA